jgi:pteridine reductase
MNTFSEAVLITGASHRIGLALAQRTILLGFHAIIHCRSGKKELTDFLNNNPRSSEKISLIHYELTEFPEGLIDQVLSLPYSLKGLVNNASIFTPGSIDDCNHLEELLRINALVPSRLAAHFYKNSSSGWIINISDAICNKPNIRFQNYRLSKALLELITKQQALLFSPKIRVNAIAPGAMLPGSNEDDEYFKTIERWIPMQKTGDIDSLLETYSYIIKTPYINGQIIRVDGGWSIAP